MTEDDIRSIPITPTSDLPGLIVNIFFTGGVRFAVCIVDRPTWWPFGPKVRLVVRRIGGQP